MSITQVLHTSINWIMGENVCSEEENMLLMNYRQCGAHGKSVLQKVAKYEALSALEEREAPEKHLIPCLVPDSLISDGKKYNNVETQTIHTSEPDAFMALYVPNNNWAPRYCKHDIILLKNRFPMSGEEALFIYKSKIFYRKYIEGEREHILRCINGRQEDLVFKRMDSESLICIGTAGGVIRS